MKPTLTVKAITKKQMEDDLVAASQSGDADKVCQLIVNGVDIHAADDYAMQIAVDKGYADVLNVLLAADAAEKTGKPSKEEDREMTRDKLNQSLIDASLAGDAEEVKLLLDAGADVHALDDYALRRASYRGHTEVVKLLLEAGANVHAWGDYALHMASLRGHTEVVKLLLEAGANVHACDDIAMQLASLHGRTEVVKLLSDWGAHPSGIECIQIAQHMPPAKRDKVECAMISPNHLIADAQRLHRDAKTVGACKATVLETRAELCAIILGNLDLATHIELLVVENPPTQYTPTEEELDDAQ